MDTVEMQEASSLPRLTPSSAGFSVVIVDFSPLIRHAIRMLIDSFETYCVVAEASNIDEALAAVDKYTPDILLTEIDLPGQSGIELLHELRRRDRPVKPIVLTSCDSERVIKQALVAGAMGYVLKSGPESGLLSGMNSVLRNTQYLSESISHIARTPLSIMELHLEQNTSDPLEPLSPRETEIFHLLASGMQNAEIARKLFISPRTVETHRSRVVRKLELKSNADLIRFAIKHGLAVV